MVYPNIAPGTGPQSTGCLHSEVISHEFLHAMGMFHEQMRPDRDDFITVHWDRIRGKRMIILKVTMMPLI